MGLQAAGHQHGGRGDKAIHHDQAAFCSGLQHSSRHGRNLQSAHSCQYSQWLLHVGVEIQHPPEHGDLARQAFAAQARAHPGHLLYRLAAQTRQQQ